MALVKSEPMLTLDDLCTQMIASGRHLTPRAARDWWTKGFLPPPQRRGLGRARGTETFWVNPNVLKQAQAADDLLGRHARAFTTIVGLWLLGFPIDPERVRAAYRTLIGRHYRSISGHRRLQLDDAVGELAGRISGKFSKTGAPIEGRNAVADLTAELLGAFFGLIPEELAELWKMAQPYLTDGLSQSNRPAEFDLPDEYIAASARYLKVWFSLPAQRHAITSASDDELLRARRVVHLVLGCLRHFNRALPSAQAESDELGRSMLIGFGRPAVPILITILRDESLRTQIIPFLLRCPAEVRQNMPLWQTTIAVDRGADNRQPLRLPAQHEALQREEL